MKVEKLKVCDRNLLSVSKGTLDGRKRSLDVKYNIRTVIHIFWLFISLKEQQSKSKE